LKSLAGRAMVPDGDIAATTAMTLGGSGREPEPPLSQPGLFCHKTSPESQPYAVLLPAPSRGGADAVAVLLPPPPTCRWAWWYSIKTHARNTTHLARPVLTPR
jgi:hypothetical protein